MSLLLSELIFRYSVLYIKNNSIYYMDYLSMSLNDHSLLFNVHTETGSGQVIRSDPLITFTFTKQYF